MSEEVKIRFDVSGTYTQTIEILTDDTPEEFFRK